MRMDIGSYQLSTRRLMILQLLGLCAEGCGGQTSDSNPRTNRGVAAPVNEPAGATSAASPTSPVASPSAVTPSATALPCGNSTPLPDRPGYEQCENGVVHRVASASCENSTAELAEPDVSAFAGLSVKLECTQHSDCVDQNYGYCERVPAPIPAGLRCEYGCVEDADCALGMNCYCQAPVGKCTEANCNTDADCGDGFLCVEAREPSGCGNPPRYACQTSTDECVLDSDCGSGRACLPTNGRWVCTPVAACGRPFLVAGKARLATLVSRDGWLGEPRPEPVNLSRAERELLGAYWAQVGLMEHASIAAFARFTLQLLQLGAPSELVIASVAAQADETRHAQQAFALASRHLGRLVGPGPLALNDAELGLNARDVLALVLLEGCIGETVAAMEASIAARRCKDPHTRNVLERIARDEEAHSDLAWRFVRWALIKDPTLREEVQATFASLSRCATDVPASAAQPARAEPAHDSSAYGFVSPSEREQLRERAIGEIILPCLEALLTQRAAA